MTDGELKKLSRQDLLEMLIAQGREVESLRNRLEETEKTLAARTIAINQAGSIAEAALQISGIFEAAQQACQDYTDSIVALSQRQASVCAQQEQESQQKARQILDEAVRQKNAMEEETRQNCEEMIRRAERESQAYWDAVSRKLNAFMTEHGELRQLLAAMGQKGSI